MMQNTEISGRVAVVTGGSAGIGFDLCRHLIDAGCEVYLCGRNAERGEFAAATLGPLSHFFQADLAVPEQIAAFSHKVMELSWGRV